jgi:hypothetical protein
MRVEALIEIGKQLYYKWGSEHFGYGSPTAKYNKKSVEIPKEYSESVYRRRKDNTMAKRKSTKEQSTIYKTYT